MVFEYVVLEKIELKTFLLQKGFSLKTVSKLLLEKDSVFINGVKYSKNYLLKAKDTVKIILQDDNCLIKKSNKSIAVVYEDEYFLVVDKPKYLATIPSKKHYDDSLAGRVLNYFDGKNYGCGIHVVNRLDYLTSGLVVFAKSGHIQYLTVNKNIVKKYNCVVEGVFDNTCGEINAKIGRKNGGVVRCVCENGKTAITKYTVIESKNNTTTLNVELLTGRTHQIRVHFSYVGHPLVGDVLYNKNAISDKDFFLRCNYIEFNFPLNNKTYVFKV